MLLKQAIFLFAVPISAFTIVHRADRKFPVFYPDVATFHRCKMEHASRCKGVAR